jgi:hypothetical protein
MRAIPRNHHRKDTSQTNYQMTYPVIQICGSVDNPIWVELVWHGHLYLPDTGFDEEGYNEIATPTRIRQQLEQFRQGVAKYIAPAISPGRLIEMSCFDPNRCSCLRYAWLEQLPDGWQLTPRQDPVLLACRMYPRNRLRPLRSSQMTEQEGLHLQSEQNWIEYHRAGVLATGAPLLGSSRILVRIESCPSENRCLQIQYTRLITIIPRIRRTNRITWDWFQALDPDSYNLTDDESSFGILWCRQPGCKNYYRYLRKAPFPSSDANRACKRSCHS